MQAPRSKSSADHMLSFKAFLSHRYKSPDVNLYFFRLFSQMAEIQFEVDRGTTSTSVTRLERMIRSADAFVGIYPFQGTWEASQSREELKKASRYFRLELDLAIRSRKPSIVFYDERYGDLLKCPDNILQFQFDSHEVTGAGGSPSESMYAENFGRFCRIVRAAMGYRSVQSEMPKTRVVVVLPDIRITDKTYREVVEHVLRESGWTDLRVLEWPLVLDGKSFAQFQKADWAVVDIGDELASTGIPAYLHGQFLPMMRLKHVPKAPQPAQPSPIELSLFSGVEVGFLKDLLVWNDEDVLTHGLQKRLYALSTDFDRINTAEEATAYFKKAALRKDSVFLSYSGKDREIGAELSGALRNQFQEVFDYRDGDSIRPGEPWLKEIFDRLSSSAIGVPLFSQDYFASGNCTHELEQMVAQHDSGKLKLLAIKLGKDPLELPPFISNVQYIRMSEFGTAEATINKLVSVIDSQQH